MKKIYILLGAAVIVVLGVLLVLSSKASTVALQLDAGGCTPGGLALSTKATNLRITNKAEKDEFNVMDEAGNSVAKLADIGAGQTKDLRLKLAAGNYTLECGSDENVAQLTVGTPGDEAVDLGSVRASASKKQIPGNAYKITNLVANSAKYNPKVIDPDMVDAWGLANRPAGAGGHIWVASNKTGNSLEYVGDVGETPLYQNDLRVVSIPGTQDTDKGVPKNGQKLGQPTGVIFNNYPSNFVVDQGAISGPSKFIFAGQDGTISAWTEKPNDNGSITQLAWATKVADLASDGAQFFGLAIAPGGDRLLAADFGDHPQIRSFDSSFAAVPTVGFVNPFVKAGAAVKASDFVPWNVTTVGDKVYVSYAATGADADNPKVAAVGEENHAAKAGRVVEYNADGSLVKVLQDKGSLNAPWGITVAPQGFGKLAGDLLVANFGDGSVAAFKPDGTFDDWARKPDGTVLVIPGIWALLPGNGASLGAADAVYFSAGPNAERDGVFGRINVQN